jgi:hypothetical protein
VLDDVPARLAYSIAHREAVHVGGQLYREAMRPAAIAEVDSFRLL